MSMSNVFVTGDVHQSHDLFKLSVFKNSEMRKNLTKNDYVVICGDFGLLWNCTETGVSVPNNSKDKKWDKEELSLLEIYESFPWTTLFVDG